MNLWLITLYPIVSIAIYLTSVAWYNSLDRKLNYALPEIELLAVFWGIILPIYVIAIPCIGLERLRDKLEERTAVKRRVREHQRKTRVATQTVDPLITAAEHEIETFLDQQDEHAHTHARE